MARGCINLPVESGTKESSGMASSTGTGSTRGLADFALRVFGRTTESGPAQSSASGGPWQVPIRKGNGRVRFRIF